MNKRANINSREDAVTKDMQPRKEREQSFLIPTLGITVKAVSMNEALEKAKEIIKAKNNKK